MTEEFTHRTHTRSDVKWLANELATTAGELERVNAELARLKARRRRLEAVHVALAHVAGQVGVPELPAVVPVVKANDKYGGRGNLRNFIRDMLKAAHPQALDTRTMADAAAKRFEMTFADAGARNHFRKYAVARALQNLRARDEVERLHNCDVAPNMVGVWRWKVVAPTVDELRLASASLAGLGGTASAEPVASPGGPPVSEGSASWR